MKVSWCERIVFPALLPAIILMGFLFLAVCEDASADAMVELSKSDRDALALLGGGVVGKALPALPIRDAAGLMPLCEGKWAYRITAGEHEGTRQETHISKTKGHQGQDLWHRTTTGDCTDFFSLNGEGAINLISEIDLEQSVITRYTPMFPIMFDGMKPGDSSQVETVVKVYALHDPTHLKYKADSK